MVYGCEYVTVNVCVVVYGMWLCVETWSPSRQEKEGWIYLGYSKVWAFPDGSAGKESACKAGDVGLIHGSGRSPGEGNSNPLQYSCLENPVDKGACQATVYRVPKSQTRLKQFSMH